MHLIQFMVIDVKMIGLIFEAGLIQQMGNGGLGFFWRIEDADQFDIAII